MSHHHKLPSLPELKKRYAFVMMLNRKEHYPREFIRPRHRKKVKKHDHHKV